MNSSIVELLKAMIQFKGSDLHLSVGLPPAIRVLTDKQRAELEGNLDLDFALNIDGVGRFRGNAHYTRGSMEAVFRHIKQNISQLEDLGHMPSVNNLCNLKAGLVLVTGVTGSGKSSTLASMMKRIADTRRGVIITIEDPIEYILEHGHSVVKQREIGQDTNRCHHGVRAT